MVSWCIIHISYKFFKKLKEKYGYYFDIKFPFGYNDIDVLIDLKILGELEKLLLIV